MNKIKVIVIVALATLVGVGVFYACQKESVAELNANETILGNKTQKLPDPPKKYYEAKDCTIVEEDASHRGVICQNSTYKPTNACASGHPCKKVGSDETLVTGYISTEKAEMKMPSNLEYFHNVIFELLRDHKTNEPRALCNVEINFVNYKSHNTIKGCIMHLALTEKALTELEIFIKKGDKEVQKEIISCFESYTISVDGVLLTPKFSKIIYLEGDKISVNEDKFDLNYEYIRKDIWEFIVKHID